MRTKGVLLMVMLLAAAPLAGAQAPPKAAAPKKADAPTSPAKGNHPEALEWLKKIETMHLTIQRVKADFIQTKKSSLFLEKIDSEGRLWYAKPDRFKVHYTTPSPLFNYILDNVAYIYNPEIKQLEIYRFQKDDKETQQLNQMLLGFGQSVKELEKYFRIGLLKSSSDQLVRLSFEPLPAKKQRLFKRCELVISIKELRPTSFSILDAQDDTTSVTIRTVEWNIEIPDEVFKLDFPAGVERIERN